MELFGEILLGLFFIMLVVVGQIYLNMDKQRARASVFISRMKQPLDTWVSLTVELAKEAPADPESARKISALADSYYKAKRYKARFNKISLVNEMLSLTKTPEGGVSDPEAVRIQLKRRDAAEQLIPFRTQYNLCAEKLSKRLDKAIPAAVGRLLHMQRLEELRDLSE